MWGVGGNAGLLGFGGSAPVAAFVGGGGGGGYYGGGSGAGMGACNPCNVDGGGGGGSSLVPAGGTSGLAALADAARVRITYQSATVAPSASGLAFPGTQPGAMSAGRTVELTNTGTTTDVVFSRVSLNSDAFIIGDASNCTGALAPGAKCAISVRFAPAAAGAHSAKLKIESNADPLEIALGGEGSSPAQPLAGPVAGGANGTAGRAGSNGTNGARGTVSKAARVTCKRKRCSVEFLAGVPKVSANGTRVQATLTRGGRVYGTVDRTARKGNLRLVLNAHRTVKPGAYTLVLKIGKTRTTRTATVA